MQALRLAYHFDALMLVNAFLWFRLRNIWRHGHCNVLFIYILLDH